MLLSDLDGYLTGLVLCPEIIPSAEWLPVIWGGVEAGPPFEDPLDVQDFTVMLEARHAEVARTLGVSARTLRFYEDKGLIEPCRIGTTRIYTRRDVARMRLILRGKRLGFSLRDIEEFLGLYDSDPQHVEQMRALPNAAASGSTIWRSSRRRSHRLWPSLRRSRARRCSGSRMRSRSDLARSGACSTRRG